MLEVILSSNLVNCSQPLYVLFERNITIQCVVLTTAISTSCEVVFKKFTIKKAKKSFNFIDDSNKNLLMKFVGFVVPESGESSHCCRCTKEWSFQKKYRVQGMDLLLFLQFALLH